MSQDDWDGKERRLTGAFDVRSQLLAEINKAEDKEMRTVLLLMFGVLEQNSAAASRMEKKIDSLLEDKVRLRQIVLDIHEPVHHKQHEWLTRKMESERETRAAAKSAARKFFEAALAQAATIIVASISAAYVVSNMPK